MVRMEYGILRMAASFSFIFITDQLSFPCLIPGVPKQARETRMRMDKILELRETFKARSLVELISMVEKKK
jgi:hypothetical protein